MRIGLAGQGATVDRVIRQAQRAEADGFASLWYTSGVTGDPLAAMTIAARATSAIELGTAIQQTYPVHPVQQAAHAVGAATAIGSPGRLTLGIGPSHRVFIEDRLGLSYATPGRHTEEYVQILTRLLRGEQVTFAGEEFHVSTGPLPLPEGVEIPVLVAALGPRLLRVAGQYTAGTIPWMANARAVETHITPRIRKAAADAGRPEPPIVAGLPAAVHDDIAEARGEAARLFEIYGTLPNYQRILARGQAAGPAEAAIVGGEASVARQIQGLFAAGATEVWLAPFGVGADKRASRDRTRDLLKDLART
jgi:F420-dependent oxidoreductase-like protein